MAISDTLSSIATNLSNAYDALSAKGATIPAFKNIENLASAIATISAGGGGSDDMESFVAGTLSAFSDTTNMSAIGQGVFAYTGISDVTLPECLAVNTNAFRGAYRLNSVSLPKCSDIGNNAFQDASFVSGAILSLPSVIQIRNYAFQNCIIDTLQIPTISSYIAAYAFQGASINHLDMPSLQYLDNMSVFYNAKITTISFPELLKTGYGTFSNMQQLSWALQSVSLPKCSEIGAYTFGYCKSLSDLYMPQLRKAGDGAFTNCTALPYIDLSYASQFASNVFSSCTGLSYVNIRLMSDIKDTTFKGCTNLQTASIPDCKIVGSGAFSGCTNLQTVNIPTAETLYPNAFDGCNKLEDIALNNVSGTVGIRAFALCSKLPVVNMPAVVSLSNSVFMSCWSLSYAKFSKLASIGQSTFRNCSRLAVLNFQDCSTVPRLGNVQTFYDTPMSTSTVLGQWGSIYVPSSLYSTWTTSTNWVTYKNRITSDTAPAIPLSEGQYHFKVRCETDGTLEYSFDFDGTVDGIVAQSPVDLQNVLWANWSMYYAFGTSGSDELYWSTSQLDSSTAFYTADLNDASSEDLAVVELVPTSNEIPSGIDTIYINLIHYEE